MKRYQAIVIGVSAGGLKALSAILPGLPAGFTLPILVTQHRATDTDDFLATHLNGRCQVEVREPDDGEPVRPGTVYIAPAGYHLLVEQEHVISLSVDPAVRYSRPSVDVLFLSAADSYGEELVGVVLTGANDDGTRGLAQIKARGGLTIVQDPATADFAAMPRHALAAVEVDKVLGLDAIGPFLRQLPTQPCSRVLNGHQTVREIHCLVDKEPTMIVKESRGKR